MELFDLLETRVVELLGQIDTLREENKTLQEKVNALDEENKTLKESLEQEQHTKEETPCRAGQTVDNPEGEVEHSDSHDRLNGQ